MRTAPRFSRGGLGLIAAVLMTVPAAGADAPKEEAAKADCAFSNAYYSGWCRVTTAIPQGSTPQHACTVVLRCLNGENSACQGNINPCRAPEIRNGWRLEEAKPAKPQPTPKP
jgi:hypothetical protein